MRSPPSSGVAMPGQASWGRPLLPGCATPRGSSMSNQFELRHVRDTLGHVSLATTSIYVHGEDDARRDAVSSAHRMIWDTVSRVPKT